MNKPLIGVALAVVIVAAGGWFYWRSEHVALPAVAVDTPAGEPQPASSAEERIAHPVPPQAADAATMPLPELGDSDTPVGEAVNTAGGAAVAQYLVRDSLVRHLVVTVDNLSRQKVPLDKRPVVPTPGAFLADGDELHATLDAANFQRYTPVVNTFAKVDMQRLAAVYLRFYSLFQKAYQDLGYPNGYFNDRLVKMIDLLLATPQIKVPISLVRPNVMYQFADPALETLPAGQKVLIRMGTDNAVVVKSKLAELRAAVIAAPPKP